MIKFPNKKIFLFFFLTLSSATKKELSSNILKLCRHPRDHNKNKILFRIKSALTRSELKRFTYSLNGFINITDRINTMKIVYFLFPLLLSSLFHSPAVEAFPLQPECQSDLNKKKFLYFFCVFVRIFHSSPPAYNFEYYSCIRVWEIPLSDNMLSCFRFSFLFSSILYRITQQKKKKKSWKFNWREMFTNERVREETLVVVFGARGFRGCL